MMEQQQQIDPIVVDREKTCPFLIRCFWTANKRPNTPADYNVKIGNGTYKVPVNEVQIYTWNDASLREITDLLKDTIPPSRQKRSIIYYSLVYPDRTGMHVMKPVSLS